MRLGKQKLLILVGDGGFATGQLALDCIRYGVTLVSRLKMNAGLFDFPSEKMAHKRGPPPSKGVRLMNFKQMLSLTPLPWKEVEIVGYNGIKHLIRYVSDTCMWGADGSTPIPIRHAEGCTNGNLAGKPNSKEGEKYPFLGKNITPEMADLAEAIVKRVLQAA